MTRTCREGVLEAFGRLERCNQRTVFTLTEIVAEAAALGPWQESTIRTHVIAHMRNGRAGDDVERVANGLYRRRRDGTIGAQRAIDPTRSSGVVEHCVAPTADRPSEPPHRGERLLAATPVSALLVIPCSGSKVRGGSTSRDGSILDLLPPSLRHRLEDARAQMRCICRVDESRLLPGWRRYTGHLYKHAAAPLGEALGQGGVAVIVSGGYGLLLATEYIGTYDREFRPEHWPAGLLEESLLAVTEAANRTSVVAFCAASTGYGKLVRRTSWSTKGIDATLVSPDVRGRGGAMVLVPRALGQAVAAWLQQRPLGASTDGIDVVAERLP